MTDDGAEPVAMLKAAGVNSAVAVLATMVSKHAFAAWVKQLPPATVSLIERPRLSQSWVPLQEVNPLWTQSLTGLFDGDLQQLFELGRLQLRADMSGIYRVFMRVASPGFVADRASSIYGVYAQHCGALTVVDRAEGRLDIALTRRPLPSAAIYEYLRGSIAGALELTGVLNLKVEIVSEPHDNERLYRATWS
jgi:hypothetical protein